MISLSQLTEQELNEVELALYALDDALVMLLERGVANEQQGIDLEELGEAVALEVERRGIEDAGYYVATAVARGELVEVVRPDGQVGYSPPA